MIRPMPGVLPEGYRFRWQWTGRHGIEVAGRLRCREYVRVVQRNTYINHLHGYRAWEDVGFWEEVVPAIVKPLSIAEL